MALKGRSKFQVTFIVEFVRMSILYLTTGTRVRPVIFFYEPTLIDTGMDDDEAE